MVAIVRESSQWLKQCFRNVLLYAPVTHSYSFKISIETQKKPLMKCQNVKTIADMMSLSSM